ncbi:MAG: AlpA family transcriptional regulator [Micavibrio sp.]
MNNRILRLPEVIKKTGLSRSSIYAYMPTKFPTPIKLGERSVGWLESDIENWITNRTLLGKM